MDMSIPKHIMSCVYAWMWRRDCKQSLYKSWGDLCGNMWRNEVSRRRSWKNGAKMKQKWRKLALVGNPYKEFRSSHLHFHKNELQNAWVFCKSCKQDGWNIIKNTRPLTGAVTLFLVVLFVSIKAGGCGSHVVDSFIVFGRVPGWSTINNCNCHASVTGLEHTGISISISTRSVWCA